MSEDPAGINFKELSKYRYSKNSPLRYADPYGLTAQDVDDAIHFVVSRTNFVYASFSFGTLFGTIGLAVPFANHILIDGKFAGTLTDEQKIALLDVVYHELYHVTDGTLQTITQDQYIHELIGMEAFQFALSNWRSFVASQEQKSCTK